MDLALFDFDGTITTQRTYPDFLRLVASPARTAAAGVALGPMIAGHRLGLVSDVVLRRALSMATFRGQDADRVKALGERYAREVLPFLVRPVAADRIQWHKGRGDRVVVVSASLDAYLRPWCRTADLDVICTVLEARDGRLTGRYVDGDCCGREKARRIRERYAFAEYACVHAYGDTMEDDEMLALADRKHLRWTDVSDRTPPP
jgi:HAD superfamily hydrolase (TIGR01490 family)